MQIIPINDNPSQVLSVQLNNQDCTVNIYQKSTGLYLDLSVSGTLIIGGVLCQNLNRIVRDAYLGFIGDLMFQDMQGASDPYYSGGLGSRFLLCYLEQSDFWGAE